MTARLEEDSKWPHAVAIVFLLVVFALVAVFDFPGEGLGKSHVGTIETVGVVSAGRVEGGSNIYAAVRLEDGRLVRAEVLDSVLVAPGDPVRLVSRRNAIGNVYEVVELRRAP